MISLSRKIQSRKHFLAFHRITFHFNYVLWIPIYAWMPDSCNFSNFKWNHAEIDNFFHAKSQLKGKIVIQGIHISRKCEEVKSRFRSIHENFGHDPWLILETFSKLMLKIWESGKIALLKIAFVTKSVIFGIQNFGIKNIIFLSNPHKWDILSFK